MSQPTVRLCRFATADGRPRTGLLEDTTVTDLTAAGATGLTDLLATPDPTAHVAGLLRSTPSAPQLPRHSVRLLAPVEQQEVWAAGVTYLRSKSARMEESTFSASAYDRVYSAPRPEIFFKSLPHKVSGPGDPVGIRADATWSVPEPELALVFDATGALKGFTLGNDMSSRDIEGENLLYLPQAKTYRHSCALGPCIALATEEQARTWRIGLRIERAGALVFEGATEVARIVRTFGELGSWLFRSQSFPHGALLLTGTGIVPPDAFTLREGDVVTIDLDGIGTLRNPVVVV